jgi:prepilin-type N-terminal cleavage/methylation domain-containing protein
MTPQSRSIHGRAQNSGRGFSLIELIAVMTMAAVLAAVAVPAMTSTGAMRKKAAATQRARDMRIAREMAQATGRNSWVVVDAATETYSIRIEPHGNPGRAQALAWTDPATGRAFVQTLGSGEWAGVTIDTAAIGGGTWVGFDRLGRPLTQGESPLLTTGRIRLDGGPAIDVEPETGRIEVVP